MYKVSVGEENVPNPELLKEIFIFLLPPDRIHAYLDPGSGSFLLQLLIAGLVGFAFLFKGFWRKFIRFFRQGGYPKEDDDTDQE